MPREHTQREDLVRIAAGCSVEPLVDGWVAWLMLLDPIASGFYRSHHIHMVQSYLSSPDRHRKAVSDPRLSGGPFCDLAAMPCASIAVWAESYQQISSSAVRFAEEFGALTRQMADDRAPRCYSDLPVSLRGRVELRRDLTGAPVVRALRGATERPRTFGAAVWTTGNSRPSMFSTPRLIHDHRFALGHGTPEEIAAVAALHHIPVRRQLAEESFEALGLEAGSALEPAPGRLRPTRRARFLGHASVVMPIDDGWLMTDPLPPASSEAARSQTDICVVLVTHCHPDHLSIEAMLSLLPQQPVVVVPAGSGTPIDPAPAPSLRAAGFREVIELRPYDQVALAGAVITALPFLGEHGSLPIDSKTAFHVATAAERVVFASDAAGLDPSVFRELSAVDRTDALYIGMEPAGAPAHWLYGPVLKAMASDNRSGHERMRGASAEEVLALAEALHTSIIRIYGTGAPGMEHVFGRSETNAARVTAEVERARDLAQGCGLELTVLATPGQTIAPVAGT